MHCGSGGNTESRKHELGPEVGESGGITLELSLTGISHVIEIMTILDKAEACARVKRLTQSIAAK